MKLKLYTAPTSTPVSLTEIKSHLGITGSGDDTRLTDLLNTAVDLVERETGRAFYTQTWVLTLDCFPYAYSQLYYTGVIGTRQNKIIVPKPPLQSVTHIKYYDTSNVQQTWNSTNYYVDNGSQDNFGEIYPVDSWPDVYDRPSPIEIRFVCGYSTQPPAIKSAIKLLVGAWNELREGETEKQTKLTELGVQRLLNSLRHGRYL